MRRSAVLTAFAASLVAAVLSFPSVMRAASVGADTVRPATSTAGPKVTKYPRGPVRVTVRKVATGPPIRAGFVGVTNEFWDVLKELGSDPTQPDLPYEQVLRNLAPNGGFDLRIGGDTTDWTWYPIPGVAHPAWARWTLTPTWMAVTQKFLEDLHAHLIIGINMEADNAAVDSAEVAAIKAGIGPTVPTTFELGNEPELYSKWPFYITKAGQTVYGRPASYSFPQIASEWDSLASQLGTIRLAGLGYSSWRALPSVTHYLNTSPQLSLLTMHTYALTPTNCQQGGKLDESSLFDGNSLENLADRVNAWVDTGAVHHVPVRVDEINAVTCGGEKGFSNSMGPALWALNILPLYADTDVTGVNFESRPNTAQNLIQPTATGITTTTTPATTTTTPATATTPAVTATTPAVTTTTIAPTGPGWQVAVQPEYYGMLAFAQLTPPGSRILSVSATASGLLTWAVQTPQQTVNIVVTNPTTSAKRAVITAAGTKGPAVAEVLQDSTERLTATIGVTLGGQAISPTTGALTGPRVTAPVSRRNNAYDITVAPASATILTANG